jgi:hypothetical protein
VNKAIVEAGAYYEDATSGTVWERLRQCADSPSMGGYCDYTASERAMFRDAADIAARVTPPSPAELVRSLDPKAIRQRLTELSSEESALRVLLRSAVARQRARERASLGH